MHEHTPIERAPRFALQLPLRYRVRGQLNWTEGRIENISRCGVLFRGQYPIEPGTPVEVTFVLPAIMPNERAAEVVCSAQVVRTVPPSGAMNVPAFAARIKDYRFIRALDIIDG